MLNALMRTYQLLIPAAETDAFGQAAAPVTHEIMNGASVEEIRAFVAESFNDRRIALRRSTGFDYTGVTHCGLTVCDGVKRGMYLRRGKRLWRVDYVAESLRSCGEKVLYLFELPCG